MANPVVVAQINDGMFNPEIHLSNLLVRVTLNRQLTTCVKVVISWGKISLDIGYISSLLPDYLLNNEWIESLLKS